MKKLLLVALLLLLPVKGQAACPTNELYLSTLTPIVFNFEQRDGSGEDTANTGNKRIALAFWTGSAWRWVGSDNLWDDTSETLLTMTQMTGSLYYYNLPAAALSATVSGKFISMRFDETDDVDVTMSCIAYVQPENRVTSGELGGAFISGTAEAASTTTTIVDTTNLTSAQANAYVGTVVEVDGETAIVKSFNPGTDTITLWETLSAEPDSKTYTMTRDSLDEIWSKIRKIRR